MLSERSIPELAAAVTRGELSAEALTEAALARIAARDGELGAFLTVAGDQARETARAIDRRRARGERLGALAGVPIAVKDALCTRDQPTTAGSRILTRRGADTAESDVAALGPWQPPYDATVVERLRAADAVLIGKANLDEFAMGSSNENSAFRPAKNPCDPSRIPGGSSGGSAVAVAAAMAAGALGSDTGGSVRQPAALTGVVGVKPSYGRVSRYGLIAFASSLDQVGVFARDVGGAAALLEAIAGHDARDSTSVARPVPRYGEACAPADLRGLSVGVPRQYFGEGVDAEVSARVRAAIVALEGAGATLRELDLPHTRYALATYYILATAEASSNLARFDGVRFGLRCDGDELGAMMRKTRGRGFGREVKRRIMLGTYVLSAGYYEAYYRTAQRVRTLVARDFAAAFREVDVIATPVSPTVAFPLGSRSDDPLKMYMADVCTLPASLAGIAALSVPCGLGDESGLPVGLQLIAPAFEEERLFRVASAWERLARRT